MLLMELPIRFGDCIRIQQSIDATCRCTLRRVGSEPLTVDAASNHYVREMHSPRTVFTQHFQVI